MILAFALALAVQDAPANLSSEQEAKCLEAHGESEENAAAFMDCLGVTDARFAPVDKVQAVIGEQHPSQMMIFASRLFGAERRPDDALFWFYAGQLRWRTHIGCQPSAPDGDAAALGAIHSMIGPPINQYAASNVDNWIATIDRVLEWDEVNRDPMLSKGCGAARTEQRRGLAQLAVAIEEQRQDFEAATKERQASQGKD